MTNETDISKVLADMAEKIKQDAYQAGWRDALAAVTKAVSEMSPAEVSAEGINFDTGVSHTPAAAGGPTVGSTPWYVLQAVKKRPGMTGSEVVSVVHEGGHKVSDGSIRTSLLRLKGRKLLVSRHGKWFSA